MFLSFMKKIIYNSLFVLFLISITSESYAVISLGNSSSVLYTKDFQADPTMRDFQSVHGKAEFSSAGLHIKSSKSLIQSNRYFALAQRIVRYHIKLSSDAKAIFQSDKKDFIATVDMQEKKISIHTDPLLEKSVSFLNANHEYLVEIHRNYQKSKIKIIDLNTAEESEIEVTNDGTGGVGKGSEGKGFQVGRQYDYYCFGLEKGTEFIMKKMIVSSLITKPTLLIYGDSITEPEGYFPTKDFANSWTQLIIRELNGNAVSSGRGGTTIHELFERIKNELPSIQAKYVMITIGTNGANTFENLSQVVEYILSQNAIPILNNIPSNESGTQIQVNNIIDQVRKKYNIKGCRFDIATSVNYDGKVVDTSTMYFEDYDWGKIYHHPNVKGSKLMFLRTLIDVPEIYE